MEKREITIEIFTNWDDYQLLDSGEGKRFERFGQYKLVRPDPQCLWKPHLSEQEWKIADAVFERTTEDKGRWEIRTNVPEKWELRYKDLRFWAKLTPFKHTGVFPEQAVQWEFMEHEILKRVQDDNKKPKILNLFAYTGIASLACAQAGAEVTHVDASRAAISWARENQQLCGLNDKPIRWILDDALKFCEREVKRGVTYNGIIMDPPVFGHGPDGDIWKFSYHFPKLLSIVKLLLSNNPLFIVVNAYAVSSSSLMLKNLLDDLKLNGIVEYGELALEETASKRLLSTGIFARWSSSQNPY